MPELLFSLKFFKLARFVYYLAPLVCVVVLIAVNAIFLVLNERKILALLTVRVGPNRVGPNGFFQTVADAIKLLFKEDIIPKGADRLLFNVAPIIFFAPTTIAFIPILSTATNNSGPFLSCDLSIGILFIMAISSIPVIGLVLGGWASSNKYSLIGGLRSAAQSISYEIPMILTVISIIVLTGSLNLKEIVDSQIGGILNWNIFAFGKLPLVLNLFPLGKNTFIGLYALAFLAVTFVLFLIYLTSAFAEVNRIPFDLPEAESELVSGYNTEFTGIKFALFFLGEYTALFIICCLASMLFLGGGHLGVSIETERSIIQSLATLQIGDQFFDLSWLLPSVVLMLKAYVLIFCSVWVRATLPRLRYDQLMSFGWKYLIPLSLINIFVVAILVSVRF
ncbi:MAG: NADH-quinone oxidoreductase subunit H [Candidatus Melainabacteria bacterium]|nr:NADH-quinone oxidoreductase subunit H [Candidatus Melainabacteria bacterium]